MVSGVRQPDSKETRTLFPLPSREARGKWEGREVQCACSEKVSYALARSEKCLKGRNTIIVTVVA